MLNNELNPKETVNIDPIIPKPAFVGSVVPEHISIDPTISEPKSFANTIENEIPYLLGVFNYTNMILCILLFVVFLHIIRKNYQLKKENFDLKREIKQNEKQKVI